MNYKLIPTEFFLSQLNDLSFKARQIIKEKLILAKENPFRYKRIGNFEKNKKNLEGFETFEAVNGGNKRKQNLKIIQINNRKLMI